jgi:hypothetical protein
MTYSFVLDRQVAGDVFPKVGKREIVLAILASITPLPHWNGCLVYEGPTPLEQMKTLCLGTRGPGADEVQERLIEGFEKVGVPVIQVYEGGPEVRESIARASGEKWVAA